jgi:hypothetical protein
VTDHDGLLTGDPEHDLPLLDGDARRVAILDAYGERRSRVFELAIGKHHEEPLLAGQVIGMDPERPANQIDHLAVAVPALGPHSCAISADNGARVHGLRARSYAPHNEHASDESGEGCRPDQPAPSTRARLGSSQIAVEGGQQPVSLAARMQLVSARVTTWTHAKRVC